MEQDRILAVVDRPAWARYGFAVVAAVVALALRLALTPLIGAGLQYVLAFPAVALVAWFGGARPGLVTTLVSAAGAVLVLETPGGYAQLGAVAHVMVFLFGGALISALAESLHRARRDAATAGLERGRAEAALSQRDAQLRTMIDASPALISYIDRDCRYRLVNRTYERWFERDRSDMEGHHAREVLGEAHWPVVRPYMERALAGEEVSFERVMEHSGGPRTLHVVYTPDRGPGGEVVGFAVLVTDVSDRKLAEERLRRAAEQTEKLRLMAVALSQALSERQVARVIVEHGRAVLGAAAGAVGLATDDGRSIEVVDSAGYPAATIERWSSFGLDADLPMATAVRTRQAVLIGSWAERVERYPELGARLDRGWHGAGAAIPLFVNERVNGVLVFTWQADRAFSDDERQVMHVLAEQCAQALDRARLHAAAQEVRARTEAASRAKDEFLAMLGHELRNPLAPILTAVHLMKLRGDVASPRERAVIERQAMHMVQLVDDLLDVSRIARGKVELKRAPLELGPVLARAVEIASPLFEQQRHQLAVDVPPSGLSVEGDETRLAQVFANLLTNAARYTPPGGHVSLTARRHDGELVVAVKDDGAGIAPDLLPRIFDLFVQGPREADRGQGGLGLGLALVQSLVALHGGRVEVRSEGAGRGSEFVVRLPALAAVPAGEHAPTSAPGAGAPGARRVLVVDDNRDAADMLAGLLAGAGHEVLVAHDGPRALEVAGPFRPEVAVLDLGLPVMDGYELGQRLLAAGDGHPPVLVAVTGYGQPADVERTRAAGFHAHLVKPVDAERLLTTVSELAAATTA